MARGCSLLFFSYEKQLYFVSEKMAGCETTWGEIMSLREIMILYPCCRPEALDA